MLTHIILANKVFCLRYFNLLHEKSKYDESLILIDFVSLEIGFINIEKFDI